MDWGWRVTWQEQCEIAEAIELCYGLEAAFDYVVGEKLPDLATRSAKHPELARELPGFVSRVRSMFTPQEIEEQLKRMEHLQAERDGAAADDSSLDSENRTTGIGSRPPISAIREWLSVSVLETA